MPSGKAEFLGVHSTWLDLLGIVVHFFGRTGKVGRASSKEGEDAFGEGHVARLLGEDGHRGDFDQRPGPPPELDSHQTKGQYRAPRLPEYRCRMNTADPLRVLTGAELADGRLPTNGIPHVWDGPRNGETVYRCTTCPGSFYAERIFQARDGLHYCVEHILVALGAAHRPISN